MMITIMAASVLVLVGIEFLFFTRRLQCDAEEACKYSRRYTTPFLAWIMTSGHAYLIRIIGLVCLIAGTALFMSV